MLRPFAVADAGELFTIRGDAKAMEFWDWPADASPQQTLLIARQRVNEAEQETALYLTARLADHTFVGVFDLGAIGESVAEVGFMVARRFWGQGYATEALRALIAEAERRGIGNLTARIHLGNEASRRLLGRLGFEEGDAFDLETVSGGSIRCQRFRLALPLRHSGLWRDD